jgi:hypothetical protein
MTHPATKPFTRRQRHLAAAALAALVASVAASPLAAQAFRTDGLHLPTTNLISVEASSNDTVQVLAGIGEIRAALQLGLLFLDQGLSHPDGSHFKTPRAHVYPEIRETLARVGAPDLEPLLQALESASDKDAVTAAFSAVEGGLQKARAKLAPTSADTILAVHTMASDAAAKINASGPTSVPAYQDAWAIIMSARGELDLLMRDPDPTIAKLAKEEAMLFDDLIISLPDPNQPSPVTVDVGLFNDLVSRLETLNNAA